MKHLKFIPEVIQAAFFGFSLLYTITYSAGLDVHPVLQLFIVLGFFLIMSVVMYNVVTKLIAVSIIGLTFLVGLISALVMGSFFEIYKKIIFFFPWLFEYVSGIAIPSQEYETALFIIVVGTCLIVSYIFTLKNFNFYFLVAIGAATFAAQSISGANVNYAAFYIFIFVLISLYFKHIYINKKFSESYEILDSSLIFVWVLPICLVVMLTASAMRVNNKPIEWPWLDEKVNVVTRQMSKVFSSNTAFSEFSISKTGYGYRNKIGGQVKLDKSHVMDVEAKRPIYLKGATKDYFNSINWICTIKDTIQPSSNGEFSNDTLELANAHIYLDMPKKDIYSQLFTDEVTVNYQTIKTRSIFTANKTYNITLINGKNVDFVMNTNGDIFSSTMLSAGFSYKVSAYSLLLDSNETKNILRKSYPGIYEAALKNNVKGSDPAITQKLADYAKEIKDKYLYVYNTLPKSVIELANKIVIDAKATTTYDKAKAIEAYLSKNYNYSLTPPEVSQNEDFIEHFLLKSKEGYCTYYATAMAILCRCVNIPARYVEGYMLSEEKRQNKLYSVTNENAHAWVEVYFEGIGWIPFEPTSPYTETFYSSFKIDNEKDNKPQNNIIEGDVQFAPSIVKPSSIVLQAYETSPLSDKALSRLLASVTAILVLLFAGLIILIIFNQIRHKNRIHKLRDLEPRDSILKIYKYYLDVLRILGLPLEKNETALDYSGRIQKIIKFGEKEDYFSEVSNAFVVARYSENPLDEEKKELVLSFYNSLMKITKKELKLLKYFVMKYVLGKL